MGSKKKALAKILFNWAKGQFISFLSCPSALADGNEK